MLNFKWRKKQRESKWSQTNFYIEVPDRMPLQLFQNLISFSCLLAGSKQAF